MSDLPVWSFRQTPPAVRLSESMPRGIRALWHSRQQDSTDEARTALRGWNEYLAGYRQQVISTPEGTFTTLVKGDGPPGASTPTGWAPWQAILLPDGKLRIYPSGIWDGKGNSVWATYLNAPSIAGGYFDVEIPPGDHGFLALDCVVDDTDDYHGILKSAAIVIAAGATAAFSFLQRSGTQVRIPLVEFFRRSDVVTIDPLRSFIFALRRYGPPTSITWDVEPL